MKKIIILLVGFLFVGMGFQPAFANDVSIDIVEKQSRSETFSNTFTDYNYLTRCVQQTTDGGYIIAGYTETHKTPGHPYDVWLVKTDSNGNMMWDETFGGYSFDLGWYVQQTTDGGYIITGENGDRDIWLIKTDINGSLEWDKTFGGSGNNCGFCVQQTSDGGYIITGQKNYIYSERGNVWLIKTDSNGSMEWERSFGGNSVDEGWYVQQTTDGGYIIIGETSSFGAGGEDVWMIKTDSNGSMEWDKTFGGPNDDSGRSGQQTSDGGYIITGRTNYNLWLIKTDSDGNLVWDKNFGGRRGYCVQQTIDNGYIITGASDSRIWLIKTDSDGNMSWNNTYKGVGSDFGDFVRQTSDGGYIITGGSIDYTWLIKTDDEGFKEWDRIFVRKNKAVTDNMLLLRILKRFPLLHFLFFKE
jgi:hypothetical protein